MALVCTLHTPSLPAQDTGVFRLAAAGLVRALPVGSWNAAALFQKRTVRGASGSTSASWKEKAGKTPCVVIFTAQDRPAHVTCISTPVSPFWKRGGGAKVGPSSDRSVLGGAVTNGGEGVGVRVGAGRRVCQPAGNAGCRASRGFTLTSSVVRGSQCREQSGDGGEELRFYNLRFYSSFSERSLALPFVLRLCLCCQDFTWWLFSFCPRRSKSRSCHIPVAALWARVMKESLGSDGEHREPFSSERTEDASG